MAYSTIDYSITDGIATVTFDRPDQLNAFNVAMHNELLAVMDEIDSDDEVRVAVFTGRGRAYCAGADLSGGTSIFQRDSDAFSMKTAADGGGELSRRFYQSLKPLIAAINGPAVGVGLTSTLPMDIRMAADSAKMGFVFARRGLVPEACSSYFLPRIVGISQAAEWVYTGRVFDAHEARRAGLVRSIHAPDELLPAAYALAREMSENTSAVSVAVSRRMLWQMLENGSPELAHEIDSRGIYYLSRDADCAEGVASFLEKRPAKFTMRVSTDLPEYMKEWQRVGSVERLVAADGPD